MAMSNSLQRAKDKPLFTPGPLTTSQGVKQAMLRDLGSRDFEFIEIVKDIRHRLLHLGCVTNDEYEAIPIQGSGTFSIEAVLSSVVPTTGRVLLIINGAYGRRMAQICNVHNIEHGTIIYSEDTAPDIDEVREAIERDDDVTHVAIVHCETTTGIINPVEEIGRIAKQHKRSYIVDAMSSFGAVPLNIAEAGIDYLVSSSNKCIEGVPGFAFTIAKRKLLLESEGHARTLSLDLLAQWQGLEKNGQFRFTPPTHVLLAFNQALAELEKEGGVEGRAARYRANHRILVSGMRELGFETYLRPPLQSYIITAFRYPEHPNFVFDLFYKLLNERGFVIYPGKVSSANSFRVGTIGRLFENDIRDLLGAIRDVLTKMGIAVETSV